MPDDRFDVKVVDPKPLTCLDSTRLPERSKRVRVPERPLGMEKETWSGEVKDGETSRVIRSLWEEGGSAMPVK